MFHRRDAEDAKVRREELRVFCARGASYCTMLPLPHLSNNYYLCVTSASSASLRCNSLLPILPWWFRLSDRDAFGEVAGLVGVGAAQQG